MTIGTNLPAGIGTFLVKVGIGSSSVGSCLKMLFDLVASLRSLARIQPSWTNVSLPSGPTSLTVAWRSTSGVDDSTHRWIAPAPTATPLAVSGADTKDTAEPGGDCSQFHSHWDALPHSPPSPVLPE